MIDKPGIYDLPEPDYRADPCPQPSLSAGVAHTLIERTPRHAWLEHPRLNPDWQPEQKTAFNLGKAAHAWLCEGEQRFVVIEADDWRGKAAKEAREAAYAAGKTPLLEADRDRVLAMVRAARAQLKHTEDAANAFVPGAGVPERTVIAEMGGVWCRCRPDWLPLPSQIRHHCLVFDYKTTSSSANPEDWGRGPLFDHGNDIRAAFYTRAIAAVTGAEVHYQFVVQETEPPYALSVIALAGDAMEIGRRKAERAIEIWRRCLERNWWPGYPRLTAYVSPPVWQERRWLEDENRVAIAAEGGQDMLALMLDWQAPIELQPQSKEAERVQAG